MTEAKKLWALVQRNIKCYFNDKFLFLVSLMTPMILLLLFVTFLRGVYIDSLYSIFDMFEFSPDNSRVVEGFAGAWLLSSILSVCSVTVAICSNAVMVSDKVEGSVNDFRVAPVKGVTLTISYFIANFIVTLIVMLTVTVIGFIYLAAVGWYLTATDVLMVLVDIVCCVLFGSLLAGVIESFISSQGGLSALSALVSAMYGFICGAYMPLSQFDEGMRNVIGVLPGTYGVGILRKQLMTSYVEKFGEIGLVPDGKAALMDGFDGNLYVAGTQIPLWGMYVILLGTCAILFVAYVSIVIIKNRKK